VNLINADEIEFLATHRIGHLATVGKSGKPHVVPAGYHFDAERGVIKIGAHVLPERGQERLYVRHLKNNPLVAFVVDDLTTEPAWRPRGVTVKGTVKLHSEGGEVLGPGFGPNWVEIVPDWLSSWGINADPLHTAVPRKV
jgi:pyridoxamine 5'-phosphate oxidase family protein